MKVVMVGPYPEPGAQAAGGVERVIDTLLPELSRHVDLTLVVPGARRDGESVNRGVRTLYLHRGPGPGAARYWTVDARRLARTVESLAPDLVHLQGAVGVGRLLRRPAIFTVHGIVDRDLIQTGRGKGWGPLARYAMAWVLRTVEATARRQIGNVIVINPYVLEALPDIAQLRSFAIPNPVDPAFCEPHAMDVLERERRIVSVGHIGPRKNTLAIIRIAAAVMKQDASVTLTICGKPVDDAYGQQCLDLVRSENLEARISFAGSLTTPELVRTLDQSACLLMASRQETAPMAIAEAHARGVVAVAPESFGIKHMIVPGRNGFFLPDGGVEAQAVVLRRALDTDWNRAIVAEDARRIYDLANVGSKTIAAYREVLPA